MAGFYSCKNCSQRFVGCHAVCQLYISEKQQYEQYKETLKKRKLDKAKTYPKRFKTTRKWSYKWIEV